MNSYFMLLIAKEHQRQILQEVTENRKRAEVAQKQVRREHKPEPPTRVFRRRHA